MTPIELVKRSSGDSVPGCAGEGAAVRGAVADVSDAVVGAVDGIAEVRGSADVPASSDGLEAPLAAAADPTTDGAVLAAPPEVSRPAEHPMSSAATGSQSAAAPTIFR